MGPLLIVRYFHRFYARATLDPDPGETPANALRTADGEYVLTADGEYVVVASA
jgi:hypothetical protein